jgi:transcriptional regulator GlxA family with amidase domain
MRTSSRAVSLLLFDEVELLDVSGPLGVLTTAGRQWNWRPFKIQVVSARPGAIDTRSQIRVESQATFDTYEAPEILIVPGGYGARRALDDAETMDWVRRAGERAEHCMGIGNGVLVLAKAGICNDLEVAAGRESAEILSELAPSARRNGTARFIEAGKVLTAPNAMGAIEASLRLVSRLLGKKQAQGVAASLGVAWLENEPGGIEILDAD